MLLVSATVKPSPTHGLGCFTDERIARGQVVWVFDPRIDLRISLIEVPDLPKPLQDFLAKYGYVDIQEGRTILTLCGDHAKHFNHSDHPNLIDGGPALDADVAAHDIEAGAELTCDYYSFDLDAERKLGRRASPSQAPRRLDRGERSASGSRSPAGGA